MPLPRWIVRSDVFSHTRRARPVARQPVRRITEEEKIRRGNHNAAPASVERSGVSTYLPKPRMRQAGVNGGAM